VRRYFLPIIASAVVLTACSSTPPAGPGALDLSSRSSVNAETISSAASGAPTPAPTVTFPATPADGPLLTPNRQAVTTASVQTLATALGIASPVTEQPGGWSAPAATPGTPPDDTPRLIVLKDARASWFYGTGTSCDLSQPVDDNAGGCVSTAIAEPAPVTSPGGSSSTVTPVVPATVNVSVAQVNTVADPLFTALGQTTAARTYFPDQNESAEARTVTGDPTVLDLPTIGAGTNVTVVIRAKQPTIDSANGTLAAWELKDKYGVVSAADALARYDSQPRPEPLLCAVGPDGQGCLARPAITITGATFGLMADTNSGASVLAPAWIFATSTAAVAGGEPIKGAFAVSAVQDRYITTPSPDTGVPNPVGSDDIGVPNPVGTDIAPTAVPGSTGDAQLGVPPTSRTPK